MSEYSLQAAYAHCVDMARAHYENFPVASQLLPVHLRRAVAAVYAFARTADDIADEGDLSTPERLARLDAFEAHFRAALLGAPGDDAVLIAASHTIRTHRLPSQLFHDLISAFRQDIVKRRYGDFPELLDYCRRSANPVGRLLLHLTGNATADNLLLSDRVCTALQLINFLQDIAQDLEENDRIYLPQDEMREYGIRESDLVEGRCYEAMRHFLALQVERSRDIMLQGAPLGKRITGAFGLELRLIIQGGLRVIERLDTERADLFDRPRLSKRDWLVVVLRALL